MAFGWLRISIGSMSSYTGDKSCYTKWTKLQYKAYKSKEHHWKSIWSFKITFSLHFKRTYIAVQTFKSCIICLYMHNFTQYIIKTWHFNRWNRNIARRLTSWRFGSNLWNPFGYNIIKFVSKFHLTVNGNLFTIHLFLNKPEKIYIYLIYFFLFSILIF